MLRPVERLKTKVCLVGESQVGKTSLIRRYVQDDFDDRWIETLGAKVTKVALELPYEDITYEVTVALFDIMGKGGFRDIIQESHFDGASGALAVADLTRPETLTNLAPWIDAVLDTAGRVPIYLLLNKADLDPVLTQEDIDIFNSTYQLPTVRTSAKTGEHVLETIDALAGEIADEVRHRSGAANRIAKVGLHLLAILRDLPRVGTTRNELLGRYFPGMAYDDLEREVLALEQHGCLAIEWRGPSDFRVVITERGKEALTHG